MRSPSRYQFSTLFILWNGVTWYIFYWYPAIIISRYDDKWRGLEKKLTWTPVFWWTRNLRREVDILVCLRYPYGLKLITGLISSWEGWIQEASGYAALAYLDFNNKDSMFLSRSSSAHVTGFALLHLYQTKEESGTKWRVKRYYFAWWYQYLSNSHLNVHPFYWPQVPWIVQLSTFIDLKLTLLVWIYLINTHFRLL